VSQFGKGWGGKSFRRMVYPGKDFFWGFRSVHSRIGEGGEDRPEVEGGKIKRKNPPGSSFRTCKEDTNWRIKKKIPRGKLARDGIRKGRDAGADKGLYKGRISTLLLGKSKKGPTKKGNRCERAEASRGSSEGKIPVEMKGVLALM